MQTETAEYYINGVLQCYRRVLAKTVTLLESRLPEHKKLAAQVLTALQPLSGKSLRLGITGIPGAGKSTFIENLGLRLAEQGHRVAVLAVDPTSRKSGGSILGDKTRMEKLAAHENTFIRPSPAGSTLGGVAAVTREVMMLCEAAGFDVVIVETVGVGQSETAVATMVDFFLALMIAGAGDELQGIKKGILEMADGIVINKCDGDNVERAEKARRELAAAIQMISPPSDNWQTSVQVCSSLEAHGTDHVWQTILQHQKVMKKTGEFAARRRQQGLDWMWSLVHEGLRTRFTENRAVRKILPETEKQVKNGELTPMAAASKLLSSVNDEVEIKD